MASAILRGAMTVGARAGHGRVAGPVAVASVGGDLQRKGGQIRLRQRAVLDGGAHGGLDRGSEFLGGLLYQL